MPGARIVLYATALSGYCAKVRIALTRKRLGFEERAPPDGYGSPAYRAIVPLGAVPAIVHGELVLSENPRRSSSTSRRSRRHRPSCTARPPSAPASACWRAARDLRLEPPLRATFAHLAPRGARPAIVAAQLDEFATRLAQLAALVAPRPFLGGDALGVRRSRLSLHADARVAACTPRSAGPSRCRRRSRPGSTALAADPAGRAVARDLHPRDRRMDRHAPRLRPYR